jgi:hypothetical protein
LGVITGPMWQGSALGMPQALRETISAEWQ